MNQSNGKICDNCEAFLSEEDYVRSGGWSYTCHRCGFKYVHSSLLTPKQQVEKFNSTSDSNGES